jgi:1-acyl-sn-glycerol-3-phosphate acyltransferase
MAAYLAAWRSHPQQPSDPTNQPPPIRPHQPPPTNLQQDASVLFFPEGTRSKDKVMGGFKKGAFSVAVKAKAPVVPITLIGTGEAGGPPFALSGGFGVGCFVAQGLQLPLASNPMCPRRLPPKTNTTPKGDVMPSGKEGQMFAGHVTIVVHPMIPTDGADADAVCDEARRVIASALPAELVGDSSVMTSE